jgi:hypothetical protein
VFGPLAALFLPRLEMHAVTHGKAAALGSNRLLSARFLTAGLPGGDLPVDQLRTLGL